MSSSTHHLSTPLRPQRVGGERGPNPGLRRRVQVLLRRTALDRELADGADADSREDLSLRAAQLVSAARRRDLADSIDEVVAVAEGSARRVTGAVPLATRDIRAARAALLDLSRDLRDRSVVHPQGVALTRRLLTDGVSPLYRESAEDDALWRAAREATAALAGH